MRARSVFVIVLTVVAAWTAPNVDAQDKAAYQQRSIARYLDTFALLDTGRNGEVTRDEAQGNVEFTAYAPNSGDAGRTAISPPSTRHAPP